MHELILLRHAEALPAAIDAGDFSRPLSPQGTVAAARAARGLRAAGVRIERVLLSPARRTSQTAAIVARELALDEALLHELPELYAATPAALRAALAAHHGAARTLLIVGHNPGLSQFGGELAQRYSGRHLPTAGYWRVPLDRSAWQAMMQPGAEPRA